jgi:hypothetical protein
MKSFLIKESLKLEGIRFLLLNEIEKSKYDFWKYPQLKKELNKIDTRLNQYRKFIEEFSENKRLFE